MPEVTPYTLVGSPISTFTRTIALGLQYKGLKYNHIVDIRRYAYPALIIHDREGKKDDVNLHREETKAIAWAIEEAEPNVSLRADPYWQIELQKRMWDLIEMASSLGFPDIEKIVQLRIKALDEGVLSEAEIREQLKDGLRNLEYYLGKTEMMMMTPDAFIFGDGPTWADFFVYPLLADLRMIPEWELVSERLKKWMELMDTLPAVDATKAGTLSDGARSPY